MCARSEFLSWVDASKDVFIARLARAVSIPSISGDPAYRPRVQEMSDWLNAELKKPASLSDEWASEPFTLTTRPDGRLVGRGSSDDKGLVLGWLAVLQWHHETQTPLPVNLRFCFEGMEENGSDGLDELVEKEREGWFGAWISDNYWLNTRKLALTYGLRGLVYFKINVSGPGRDLHSDAYSVSSFSIALFPALCCTNAQRVLLGIRPCSRCTTFSPLPALRALLSRYRRPISAFILARYRTHLPATSATEIGDTRDRGRGGSSALLVPGWNEDGEIEMGVFVRWK
ncbi:hypothetical protein B0H16DRAFT_1903461 [Mycena metata]|uniref:Uncharacterized protein n=1 Tax=Mycena metata TaxID=1033252 RepID=A0AAD7DRP9_9AGAR|nr:hypothetical protein B0H16DRAFT_1903461 [Mycena metata]